MSQQLRFQGIKGDECDCGRRASIRHCPVCGSARLYAYAHPEYHTNLHGELKLVDCLFRCYGCGHKFVDEERQWCEAPPFGIALAKLKVQRLAEAAKTGEFLRPQDEKLAKVLDKLANPQAEPSNGDLTPEVKAKLASVEVPERPKDFIPPNDLSREDFDIADRAFRLEWANKKLMGQDPGITVEEYVERKLKGEVFE